LKWATTMGTADVLSGAIALIERGYCIASP